MKRISSLLVVALLLIAAADGKPSRKKKLQLKKDIHACTFNLLVDFGVMAGEKMEVEEDVDCIHFVREKLDAYYREMEKSYKEDEELGPYTDCIIEKLKDFKAGAIFLQKEIYNKDKTLTKLSRDKVVTEARVALYVKYQKAEELCAPNVVFGNSFDLQYGDITDANEDETDTGTETEEEEIDLVQYEEDYCQRKHLVDAYFVSKYYNITLNPKNVNVDNFDCDKIWNESALEYLMDIKDEFVGALNSPTATETRCIFTTLRSSKLMEYMLTNWVLSEIKVYISEEKRIAVRTSYINYNSKLYADVMKCRKTE